MGGAWRTRTATLALAVFVAGCGPGGASPSGVPSVVPSPSAVGSSAPSTAPSDGPSSSAATDPFLGQVVATISDGLRVRSEPRVADDSVKYAPLLPIATELRVLDGPVSASGYTWYKVEPVTFSGLEGPGYGWVAMASSTGEPWIALRDAPIAGIELASSKVARAPADPAAAKAMAASLDAFGIVLYQAMLADPKLALGSKNAVYSPLSVALALAMARAGARGATAAQIDAALRVKGWDALGQGLNSLSQALAVLDASWTDLEGASHVLALRSANAAFGQQGWPIEPELLDALASDFGAGLQLVDYIGDPAAAAKLINAWVKAKTNGRIPQLLDADSIDDRMRLILANAIYLKANWEREFIPALTDGARFTRRDGAMVSVPTMHLYGGQTVPYASGSGWQATELRYLGAKGSTPVAMTVILPGDLAQFEDALSPTILTSIVSSLDASRALIATSTHGSSEPGDCGSYPYTVELFMPRFSAETKGGLIPALSALGIRDAFDPTLADLTGTSQERPLFIGLVTHQANIDVDERGTEAAAATVVGDVVGGCTGPEPAKTVTLKLDHPFFYVIRDITTGAILFMGRVVDPSVGR
jgi:serpin B